MVEIRITSRRSSSRGEAGSDGEVFVFDQETDAACVRRWQRGDLAAASIVIQRHEAMVYAAAYRVIRNHAAAEDVCQDAFLKAHTQIRTLQQPGAFPGWVRRIATRAAIDELRKRPTTELADDEVDPAPGPAEEVEARDVLDHLREQIAALPLPQRAAVVLCDVEGMSIREAAQQLAISEGAVKMRLSRARANLRAQLSPAGGAGELREAPS